MLKIKNYFIKHPKLKRLIKILGIITIVLSFLFNVIIVCSVILNANKDNIKRPLVYDTINQPVKSMISTTDEHYFISNGDFQFDNIYNNLVTIYGSQVDMSNTTFQFEYNTDQASLTLDRLDFCIYDSNQLENNSSYDIVRIYVGREVKTSTYGDTYFNYYFVFQYMDDNNHRIGVIYTNYVYVNNTYFGYDTNGYIVQSVLSFYDYTSGVALPNYTPKWYFTLYGNNTKGIFYDLFIHNRDKGYLNGYVDGYSTGLTTGKDIGYAEGYQDGIDYAGSHSMTSDPFTLISRAFTSVASILNIQVLPNLTLGVLIFTPLIVTIIVVVVKFMRG